MLTVEFQHTEYHVGELSFTLLIAVGTREYGLVQIHLMITGRFLGRLHNGIKADDLHGTNI